MADRSGDEVFLRRAVRLACESVPAGGGPFGAVVVRNGAVVAEGANRVTPDGDPTAHAEVVAIRAAARALGQPDLRGCVLYSSCEPCPMCAGAIGWARLDRAVFAATRHDAAAVGFEDARLWDDLGRPGAARTVPTEQGMLPDAVAPFRLWQAHAGRVPY